MELSGFLLFISSYCEAATFRQSNIGSAVCSVQFALLLVLSSTWRLMVTLHLLQKCKIDIFIPRGQRTIQKKINKKFKQNLNSSLQIKLLNKISRYLVVDMSHCKCYNNNIYLRCSIAAIRFLFGENFFHQMIPSPAYLTWQGWPLIVDLLTKGLRPGQFCPARRELVMMG